MIRRPPRSTRTATLFPYTTLFRAGLIKVPAGTETDFASVPRWPLTFALLGQYGHAAAVLHDWLYSSGQLSRGAADLVFFNALRSSGIADRKSTRLNSSH